MRPQTKFLFLILAGIAAIVYFSFLKIDAPKPETWGERDATVLNLDTQLKRVASEIKEAQGTSACDTDEQCKIVGLGTRVCGDYKDFLIYSIKDANEIRLRSLVSKFNETHEKISNLSTGLGHCGVKPARIYCVGGHCTQNAYRGN